MPKRNGYWFKKPNGTQGYSQSSGSNRAPQSGYLDGRQSSLNDMRIYDGTAQSSRRHPFERSFSRNNTDARTNRPTVVQQNFFTVNQYYGDASRSGSNRRGPTAAERIGMPPHLCDENGLWFGRDASPRRDQQSFPSTPIRQQERRESSRDSESGAGQASDPKYTTHEIRPDWAAQDLDSRPASASRDHDDYAPEVEETASDSGESIGSDGPIITHFLPSRAVSQAPSFAKSRGRQRQRNRHGH